MPTSKSVNPLRNWGKDKAALEVSEPIGCHLQAIAGVGGCFGYGAGAAFDALLKQHHGAGKPSTFHGEYFTATIVSIRIPDETTVKELENRGFKLLGIQDGAHGNYEMALYGKGFKEKK